MEMRVKLTSILALLLSVSTAADIEPMLMDSDPHPQFNLNQRSVVRRLPETAVVLIGVPTSTWTYGCSATAAGMIFGYYDRNGYPDIYTGRAGRGVAPIRNIGKRTSLIASQKGRHGSREWGHVNDYWISYGRTGPDPWQTASRSEHTPDCIADFLGTNQWRWDYYGNDGRTDFNIDGSTSVWRYSTSGAKLYDYIPPASAGLPQTSLTHGLRLFAEWSGYTVLENYLQIH